MAIMRQLEGQMQCNNFNLKTAFLIGPVSPKMSTYYGDHQLLPNIVFPTAVSMPMGTPVCYKIIKAPITVCIL